MSRRSFRLMSSGYYNSDEDSDSSSVTNISYRENPVKVFKKKARTSKARSKTPTRVKSNGVSGRPSPSISHGHPSPPGSQPTMGATAYVSTVATPEPATYSSSTTTETPASDKSHHRRPGIHHQPNLKELRQSTMESSGYSSSEDPNRRPTRSATNSTSRTDGSSVAGYRHRINRAFFSLMDSVSLMAIPVRSKVMHAAALAKTPLSSRVKKACGLFLLLFIIILCIWFLLPWFTSVLSHKNVAKPLSQTEPQSEFASSVVDPAVVNAAVEAKMQNVMEELQLKQEKFLSQLKEIVQLDLENMKARLEGVDSSNRLFLERELAVLAKQLSDFKTDFKSATASLKIRIQDLEAQNTKLSEEWASSQQRPPPAPSPDTSTKPAESQLTPELQQAIKKWLTDYIREQGTPWLIDKGSGSESGYPMADKMPDFALETQGASVISTRCSETYRVRSACVSLFGFPLWYPVESPRTVIQGSPVLLPGKCWAFHGVQGTLVISLSHPITITHVTLDHLPRYKSPTGRIDSAPKDFEVYGMKNDSEEGTLLGTFTYDEYGESTQTFRLPNPSDEVYRFVELRVLSNWGHVEYTCLYRFRVHGHISK